MNLERMASTFGFKFLVGLTFVSTLTFTQMHLFQALHNYLTQFTNGNAFELIMFGAFAILSWFGLYILFFMPKRRSTVVSQQTALLPTSSVVQVLLIHFSLGFISGFTKPEVRTKKTS